MVRLIFNIGLMLAIAGAIALGYYNRLGTPAADMEQITVAELKTLLDNNTDVAVVPSGLLSFDRQPVLPSTRYDRSPPTPSWDFDERILYHQFLSEEIDDPNKNCSMLHRASYGRHDTHSPLKIPMSCELFEH